MTGYILRRQLLNSIYNSINKLNSMSGPKLLKFMDETYSLGEEKLEYLIQNFSNALINANEDLYDKLFIGSLDDVVIDKIHFKYYQISKNSKMHIKKNDAYAMINSMLYIDAMEELFQLMNNSISISHDEFVFCYTVAMQSGILNDYIKKTKERYKVEKNN